MFAPSNIGAYRIRPGASMSLSDVRGAPCKLYRRTTREMASCDMVMRF